MSLSRSTLTVLSLASLLAASSPSYSQEPAKPADQGPAAKQKPASAPAAAARSPAARGPFVFRDVGDELGLFPHVGGIKGHAAGWGDVDGDGWIDLYVATFHAESSKPNMFFRNVRGRFQLDDQPALQLSARASASLFADLDNDGDLDLYVSSMPSGKESRLAKKQGRPLAGCTLLRNDGGGKFTNIAEGNGACPEAFGGRSATVLDYDGDGLLDLLVGEDPIPGYNGSKTKSTRLFRNKGGLQFEDVSRAVGLPEGMPGLGVAAADVNNDGLPDLFVAANSGGNLLFLNDGRGKFREAPESRRIFAWEGTGGDNMICGVCFGDVNRDGLLDMVIGQHFSTPWVKPVPIRLYLNRGIQDGNPKFEDVTSAVGLVPLALKAPHVEIQDFDNDGWPDVYTSIVKFADGQPHPVIYRNLGVRDGLPRFRDEAFAVNDFPTAEDKAIRGSGAMFQKIIQEKKIIYMAPGPSGDFDNDGRLDLFLPNWWIESRSLLLRNETPQRNWLQVKLDLPPAQADPSKANEGKPPDKAATSKGPVNRMGIGARVKIYTAGKLGEAAALLGCQDISAGYGYASGQASIAHFGLGDGESVDVEVTLPHGKGALAQRGAKANQRLILKP